MSARAKSLRLGIAVVVALALPGCPAWLGGATLGVEPLGVYDLEPDSPIPRFVLAVTFENQGTEPVTLEDPVLRVRSIHTGGDLPVAADRLAQTEGAGASLAPGARRQVVYDLWRLANLYSQQVFPELRQSPDDLRFRLVVETDRGTVASSEWSGVKPVEDPEAFLRGLEGETAL